MIREYLIKLLGGVPLPKAKDGQYLRKPSVCRNPVRKKKEVETNTDKAQTLQIETENTPEQQNIPGLNLY